MGSYIKIFIELALIFENFHQKLCEGIHQNIFSFVKYASEIAFYTLTHEKLLNNYVKVLIKLTQVWVGLSVKLSQIIQESNIEFWNISKRNYRKIQMSLAFSLEPFYTKKLC